MLSMGFERFIHIIPALKSNVQLLKDFKKQLSHLVDLVQDRSQVQRHPVFVMFRPSGRLKDEFEDVVQTYIDKTIGCHYDDIILIIAFNNTTVHSFFLGELRHRFKFVEAITLSNGSIDATSNRITFENLKQILTGEFSFKELSAAGLDRHDASVVVADLPFKTTVASDESTSSPISPIQVSQPTSHNERKQDSCDSSQIHPNQHGADTKPESECKHLSEVILENTTERKSTERKSTEDVIVNQQGSLDTEIHSNQHGADTNAVSESECKDLSEVVPEEITQRKSTEDDFMNHQGSLDTEATALTWQDSSLERNRAISSDALTCAPSDQTRGIESIPTTQVKQTKRGTSTSFIIEGCIDAQSFPVVFKTQTIHDELENMSNGDESHQIPIEKRFKLPPGNLLDILIRLQEELDFVKEKKSGNSDLMELSSETLRRLERQLALRPGELKAVIIALYNPDIEKSPEVFTETRQESRSHYSLDHAHSEATHENPPTVQLKQQQGPPASFVLEGYVDKAKFPVEFKTQTIHDELEQMRHGDESRQIPIEQHFKLRPGNLLNILTRLEEELDFIKNTSVKSDHMTLSSAMITILERQFELKSGELKDVLHHLYGHENKKENKRRCLLM